MRVLGISAFYHDSAAALIEDGASVPPHRRSASRARSTIQLPAARHRILPDEAGISSADSTMSLSTTSRS